METYRPQPIRSGQIGQSGGLCRLALPPHVDRLQHRGQSLCLLAHSVSIPNPDYVAAAFGPDICGSGFACFLTHLDAVCTGANGNSVADRD